MKTRLIRVSTEFDNLLLKEVQRLRQDCMVLGIKPLSKVKATKILTKRLIEHGVELRLV